MDKYERLLMWISSRCYNKEKKEMIQHELIEFEKYYEKESKIERVFNITAEYLPDRDAMKISKWIVEALEDE